MTTRDYVAVAVWLAAVIAVCLLFALATTTPTS